MQCAQKKIRERKKERQRGEGKRYIYTRYFGSSINCIAYNIGYVLEILQLSRRILKWLSYLEFTYIHRVRPSSCAILELTEAVPEFVEQPLYLRESLRRSNIEQRSQFTAISGSFRENFPPCIRDASISRMRAYLYQFNSLIIQLLKKKRIQTISNSTTVNAKMQMRNIQLFFPIKTESNFQNRAYPFIFSFKDICTLCYFNDHD